jgi:uncharacterized protein with HEPN domain
MKFRQPQRAVDHLQNALAAIARIETYLQGQDEAGFLGSELVQDAVIRNLEVIGEALHQVEESEPVFRAEHSDVPWDEAYGMRNLLSHGYFKVRADLVWSTVKRTYPHCDNSWSGS